MTTYSSAAGVTSTTKDATHSYGPYIQQVPFNPWNDSDSVAAADGTDVGWVYDATTGNIWLGVEDVTDATVKQELIDAGAAKAAAAAI